MSENEKDLPKWAQDADIDTPEEMAEDGQGQSGAGGPQPTDQHQAPPPETEDE